MSTPNVVTYPLGPFLDEPAEEAPMPDFPRPDLADHDPAAWLGEYETKLLDAAFCPDLTSYVSTSVHLAEYPGKGRTPRLKHIRGTTPEQEARSKRASELLEAKQQGHFLAGELLRQLAATRRLLHYARLGIDAPALPEVPRG